MKRFLYLFSIIFILASTIISCNKDDVHNPEVPVNLEIEDFVWKGLNAYYFWQEDVSNLADDRFSTQGQLNDFLEPYIDRPEELFESLLYQQGTEDRFSWFIEDYEIQNQQFQGISKSFGFRLTPVKINAGGDVIFYIKFVSSNSPASNAGINRGDIINAINGVIINESNYSTVTQDLSEETVNLSFVTESGGILTATGDKTITSVVLSDNPVHVTKIFNDIDGKKVGYLVYNGFRSSYNDELNAAFELFKNEGIVELILDLRLNGGGSVSTSAYLASMIYANAGTEKFAELKFNSKNTSNNSTYEFQNTLNVFSEDGTKIGEETINRLSTISKLYVLTSSGTASASEMIINGLRPFIPVKLIGETTYGKNVGSITLYDSPSSGYTRESSANKDHKFAMQPIVFQIFNKNGESDYTQGFLPGKTIIEAYSWNQILPFCDENEVLLKAALDDIKGITKPASNPKNGFVEKLELTILEKKFDYEMYITLDSNE